MLSLSSLSHMCLVSWCQVVYVLHRVVLVAVCCCLPRKLCQYYGEDKDGESLQQDWTKASPNDKETKQGALDSTWSWICFFLIALRMETCQNLEGCNLSGIITCNYWLCQPFSQIIKYFFVVHRRLGLLLGFDPHTPLPFATSSGIEEWNGCWRLASMMLGCFVWGVGKQPDFTGLRMTKKRTSWPWP